MPPLVFLFIVILACGIIAALLRQAPDSLIAEPYKTWLVYFVLVCAVFVVLDFFHLLPSFLSGMTTGITQWNPRR